MELLQESGKSSRRTTGTLGGWEYVCEDCVGFKHLRECGLSRADSVHILFFSHPWSFLLRWAWGLRWGGPCSTLGSHG